jgi:hypothetical protein
MRKPLKSFVDLLLMRGRREAIAIAEVHVSPQEAEELVQDCICTSVLSNLEEISHCGKRALEDAVSQLLADVRQRSLELGDAVWGEALDASTPISVEDVIACQDDEIDRSSGVQMDYLLACVNSLPENEWLAIMNQAKNPGEESDSLLRSRNKLLQSFPDLVGAT